MKVALAIGAIAVALLGAWQIALPTLSYVYLALAQGHPVLRTTLAAWELRWTGGDRAQIDEHTWLVIDADTGPRVWVDRIAAERGLVVIEQMGSGYILAPRFCSAPIDGKWSDAGCAQAEHATATSTKFTAAGSVIEFPAGRPPSS